MQRQEAEDEAAKRNKDAGQAGDTTGFYLAVEVSPGDWQIQRQEVRRGWLRRIFDALVESPGP